MLVITPLTTLFKIICLILALLHRDPRARRSVVAKSRRISRAASPRHDRAHASRRQRRVAHDLHRPRASRPVALRHDRVRQERCAFRRSRPEIFPLRQHSERVHAFRTQLHLRNDWHDWSRRDRAETECATGFAVAFRRNRHDSCWLRLQNRGRAVSSLGA